MATTEKWSASRIDTANYCDMKYYLKYVETPRPASLNPSAYRKGSLFHSSIETFWLLMDPSVYENNPELSREINAYKERHPQKIENLTKGKKILKPKYNDPESFAKYVRGKWLSKTVIPDSILKKELKENLSEKERKKIEKKLIDWSFDGEQYVFNQKLPGICMPLFEYLLNEGPPLYSELSFDFELNNLELNGEDLGRIRFNGFIDEIRLRDGKAVIRDYKSGNPWGIKEMKIEFDPQLTFYNLGLASLCYDDQEFAKIIGVEDIADQFMGNPIFIYPEFDQEFFMVEALSKIEEAKKPGSRIKDLPKSILPTKRSDVHFNELIKMINGTRQIRERENIYAESGRKCDLCEMKKPCAERIYENQDQLVVNKNGQRFLSFINSPIKAVVRRSSKRKKEKFADDQMKFHFGRKEPWKGTYKRKDKTDNS